jgi:hypothetical protein
MNRKTQRIQKRIERRRAGKTMFISKSAPVPSESIATLVEAARPSAPVVPQLTPHQQRILDELDKFAAEINEVLRRASLRMMIQGLREGSADLSKRE